MKIRIRNKWHYKGAKWDSHNWDWEVFLDDNGSGELSNVDFVEYVLVPSFPHPIRKITDPKGGFLLKSSSFGTFTLLAFVYTKDGRKEKMVHNLMLGLNPIDGISD